jgi:ribosomal protein L37AE/L43A
MDFVKVKDRKTVEIRVVEDHSCPFCGSKFPNRPKVHDSEGWWWRCYTKKCVV